MCPPTPTPYPLPRGSLAPAKLVQAMDSSFSAVTYCRKVVGQEGVSPNGPTLLRPLHGL